MIKRLPFRVTFRSFIYFSSTTQFGSTHTYLLQGQAYFFPVFFYYFCRNTDYYTIIWHIFRNYCIRPNFHVIPYNDSTNYFCSRTNGTIFTNSSYSSAVTADRNLLVYHTFFTDFSSMMDNYTI